MTSGRALPWLMLATTLALAPAAPVAAQEWRVGAQVGRIHYDAAAAATATTGTSLALAVSRISPRDWLGATAGIPLSDQPFWAVAGLWKQWRQDRTVGLGVDVSGHAFVQRDVGAQDVPLVPLEAPVPERDGEGAGGEATVLGFAEMGSLQLELRGGAAGQTSQVANTRMERVLPLVGGRVMLDLLDVQLSAEGRHWWAADSGYSYLGGTAQYGRGPVAVWASAGSWLEGGSGDAVVGAGATLALGERLQLEGSWREAAFDPLYNTTTTRSFSLGMSIRVGGGGVVHAPVPARYENGRALIRVRVPALRGAVRIAGDFTNWEPRPMSRREGAWEFTIPLEPGVYSYAFVDEQGEWFVPESVPGRRSDGMGGWQAVLIVE